MSNSTILEQAVDHRTICTKDISGMSTSRYDASSMLVAVIRSGCGIPLLEVIRVLGRRRRASRRCRRWSSSADGSMVCRNASYIFARAQGELGRQAREIGIGLSV